MTNEALRNDLEYASRIAREGEATPLLGGEIGFMWTSLATIALMLHGAVLAGWIDMDVSLTGLIWLVYGVIGTVLSIVLGRRLSTRAGVKSFANRVSEACWFSMGVIITIVAVTVVVSYMAGKVDLSAFNFIVPTAFALSAAAYTTLARLMGHGYLLFAAMASAISVAVTLYMVVDPAMYFVAGLLLIFAGVLPSFIELRRAGA